MNLTNGTILSKLEKVMPVSLSNAQKMLCERKAFHKDPHPACRRLIKSSTNKRHTQHSSHQMEPPAKQMTCPQRRQHPCQEEKCSLSAEKEEEEDHEISEVQAYGSMCWKQSVGLTIFNVLHNSYSPLNDSFPPINLLLKWTGTSTWGKIGLGWGFFNAVKSHRKNRTEYGD